ncbi:MAG: Zn-ribbon containing protein [Candidatus Woesearchaeota archaeon]|nr:Zn-ribbon containing protein [Candidatus Woesearchaeota archaeon]
MPHQCVRCGVIYDDDAKEIMKGCSCGSKLFFYIKQERFNQLKRVTEKLSDADKQEIEKDVLEIIGETEEEMPPVVLDFSSVRVSKPGMYELDVVKLFKEHPVIYELSEGKYIVDLASAFAQPRKKKI